MEILAWPPKFLFVPTLDNFKDLFSRKIFITALTNSCLISLSAMVIAIVVSYLAAYAFSRLKPKLTVS